ncbi:MAG: hypothetical protein IJB26_03485 [Clostridia bacterium]|nr:hypothetical protein [Clostridia bacterium]
MKKCICLFIVVCLLVSLSGCGLFDEGLGVDMDSLYISAAKSIVADQLRNPSSAVYNNAYVYEKDDYGRAIVYLDVSSQNGFGGYARDDFWVCINEMTSEGEYSYSKLMSYCTSEGLVDYLKSANNFGEPK